MMSFKPTPSQNLILQFVFSAAIAAAIGAINAGFQYVAQGGKVNLGVLVSLVVATFAFAYGNALKQYIPSHIKEVLQAKDDTSAQLTQKIAQLEARLSSQPDVQSALSQISQQQQTQTMNAAQQVAQQVTDSVLKAVAQQAPAQPVQAPAPQPVTVNITPVTPMTATVSQPTQDAPPAQQAAASTPEVSIVPISPYLAHAKITVPDFTPSFTSTDATAAPTPQAPPDVALMNTASMPVTAPATVANPLADFLSGNEDTQTAVQVASARRATQ